MHFMKMINNVVWYAFKAWIQFSLTCMHVNKFGLKPRKCDM